MIISQTLLHIGIASKYEKYIRLIISFMVAAQIIFAFAALGQEESENIFAFLEEDFQIQWQMKITEFEEKMEVMKDKMEEKILQGSQNLYEESETETAQKKIQIEKIKIE